MAEQNLNSTKTILLLITIIATGVGSSLSALAMHSYGQDQANLSFVAPPQSGIETPADPAVILGAARVIYICSRTAFVKSEVIENELMKRAEFGQAGIVVTRDPQDADLVMEVRRSNFTTEYPYIVVDTRTRLVVASGKVNSLFGTAAAKIAKGFIKQLQKARTPAGERSKK